MIDKQQIVVDLLNERLPQTKVGIIVKGVDSIDADKIIASVSQKHRPVYLRRSSRLPDGRYR